MPFLHYSNPLAANASALWRLSSLTPPFAAWSLVSTKLCLRLSIRGIDVIGILEQWRKFWFRSIWEYAKESTWSVSRLQAAGAWFENFYVGALVIRRRRSRGEKAIVGIFYFGIHRTGTKPNLNQNVLVRMLYIQYTRLFCDLLFCVTLIRIDRYICISCIMQPAGVCALLCDNSMKPHIKYFNIRLSLIKIIKKLFSRFWNARDIVFTVGQGA